MIPIPDENAVANLIDGRPVTVRVTGVIYIIIELAIDDDGQPVNLVRLGKYAVLPPKVTADGTWTFARMMLRTADELDDGHDGHLEALN